jgi:hypothetical protein
MTQKLTQKEALTLLETYGGEADWWPSHCARALRDACELDPVARAAQAREAGLDDRLQQIFTPASDALKSTIVAAMVASTSFTDETIFPAANRMRLSAGVSALVACLLIGFFGAGFIEQQYFLNADADIALAYSSLELWTAID